MRCQILLVVVLLGTAVAAGKKDCKPYGSNGAGIFMKSARTFDLVGSVRVTSPDKGKTAELHKGKLGVFVAGRQVYSYSDWEMSAGGELGWSSDSKAFSVTWSDGGAVGSFHVDVFVVSGNSVRHLNVSEPILRDFRTRHRPCPRHDNARAAAWLDGSSRLMVVTETYPTGDCPDLKEFGYIVAIPSGRILGRYSRRELLRRWRNDVEQIWDLRDSCADVRPSSDA